jgi:hypothetical protein
MLVGSYTEVVLKVLLPCDKKEDKHLVKECRDNVFNALRHPRIVSLLGCLDLSISPLQSSDTNSN